MMAALVGFIGVLVGTLVAQALARSHQENVRRLDALVAVVAASGRVISAHERLFDLFEAGISHPLTDERAIKAALERNDAHTEWRSARARIEILFLGDLDLFSSIEDFEKSRIKATGWVRAYYQEGEAFDFSKYASIDKESWVKMQAARDHLITAIQAQTIPRRRYWVFK